LDGHPAPAALVLAPNPLGSDSDADPPHGSDWPLGTFKRYLRHAGALAMDAFRRSHSLFLAKRGMFPRDGFWSFDVRFK
jgi:hypothetical protein